MTPVYLQFSVNMAAQLLRSTVSFKNLLSPHYEAAINCHFNWLQSWLLAYFSCIIQFLNVECTQVGHGQRAVVRRRGKRRSLCEQWPSWSEWLRLVACPQSSCTLEHFSIHNVMRPLSFTTTRRQMPAIAGSWPNSTSCSRQLYQAQSGSFFWNS